MAYTKNKNPRYRRSTFGSNVRLRFGSGSRFSSSLHSQPHPSAARTKRTASLRRTVKRPRGITARRLTTRPSTTARRAISYHENLNDFPTRFHRVAKNSVLTIIATATMMVMVFIIFNLIATPEYLIKKEVEAMTADYYENYFYPNILKNNSIASTDVVSAASAEAMMTDILGKYTERGFSHITLNQLLLYDNRKHYSSAASLAGYCDFDKTAVKIYPEPPFTSTSYRTEYSYSCSF